MQRPPKERVDLRCPECGELMVLRYTKKFESWFYGCVMFPDCNASHGAHPDGAPLGTPTTREGKQARIEAHEVFDALWRGGEMTRGEAYRWLRTAMGLSRAEAHIGNFDEEQCDRLIALVQAHMGECPSCFGKGHAEGCEALEPAWDIGDLMCRGNCQGCCPNGCKSSGMQLLADRVTAKLKGLFR